MVVPKAQEGFGKRVTIHNRGHNIHTIHFHIWCAVAVFHLYRYGPNKGVYMKIKVEFKKSNEEGQIRMTELNGKLVNYGGRTLPF